MVFYAKHLLDGLVCWWGEMLDNVAIAPPNALVLALFLLSGVEVLEERK